jgi:uncharacterized protein YqgC (DUF456 family)
MARERTRADYTGLALIAGGVVLVVMVWAGYTLGAWVDARLHTGSRWATVGLIIGLILGVIDLYRIAALILKNQPPITPAPPEKEEKSADE